MEKKKLAEKWRERRRKQWGTKGQRKITGKITERWRKQFLEKGQKKIVKKSKRNELIKKQIIRQKTARKQKTNKEIAGKIHTPSEGLSSLKFSLCLLTPSAESLSLLSLSTFNQNHQNHQIITKISKTDLNVALIRVHNWIAVWHLSRLTGFLPSPKVSRLIMKKKNTVNKNFPCKKCHLRDTRDFCQLYSIADTPNYWADPHW